MTAINEAQTDKRRGETHCRVIINFHKLTERVKFDEGRRKKIREERTDLAVASNGEQGAVIPATSLLHRCRRRDYGEEKK